VTTLQWDHTVHYVNDLEKAIEMFRSNGFHAFHGGSHTEWGTYNALSYFGLNYIEFLGVENQKLVKNVTGPNQVVKDSVKWLPEHEIFSRVAIRTDDIETVYACLTEHHLECSPIMAGKRRNAQGQLIEWKMVTISGNFQGLDYPFFIQWGQSDEERYENLQEAGAIQEHLVGDVIIKEAVFQVSNPVEIATHWKEVFGLSGLEKGTNEASLTIGNKKFVFQKGDENALKQLVFGTSSPTLKGKILTIGEAEYVF
jgi:hypothetical protein